MAKKKDDTTEKLLGIALVALFLLLMKGYYFVKEDLLGFKDEEPKTEEVAVHPDFEPAVASEPDETDQDDSSGYTSDENLKPIPITFDELSKRLFRNAKPFSLIVSEYDDLWFMGGSENRLEADVDDTTKQIKRLELVMPLTPDNAETIVKAVNTLIPSLEPKQTKVEYDELLERLEFVNVSADGIIGGEKITRSDIDWMTTTDDTVDPKVLRLIVTSAAE